MLGFQVLNWSVVMVLELAIDSLSSVSIGGKPILTRYYHDAPDGTLASVHAAGTQYEERPGWQYGFPNTASKSPVVTLYLLDIASQKDELIEEKAGSSRSASRIV